MRQQTLLIRIGDEDRASLDRLAGELGVSRAAIIRRALSALRGSGIAGDLGSTIELKALQASLLKVGRNLNQIARHLNSAGEVEAEQLGLVLSRIIALNDATRQVLGYLASGSQVAMVTAVRSQAVTLQMRS
ncbi:MAG: CopG family transcriptional regulator [Beijerinckiaceae bacterium]